MKDSGWKMQDREVALVIEDGVGKLRIYTAAHRLGVQIHQLAMNLPKFELYEEGSQIRRSSKSVSSNIVEGYALRRYKAEFLRYLYRAYGSAEETVEHLDYLWETRSFSDESSYRAIREECLQLNRQLFTFIQQVQRQHEIPDACCETPAEYEVSYVVDLNPES